MSPVCRPVRRRLTAPALALLAVAVLLGLAACRSAPTPTPTATSLPTIAPTPIAAQAEDIVAGARQRMQQVGSFHFQVTQTGGGTPLIPGVEVVGTEGDAVLPGQLQASLSATVMGAPTTVKIVAVGGAFYVTNPLTGKWQVWTDGTNLLGNFNPSRAMDSLLAQATGLVVMGADVVAGAAAYHLSGTVDAGVLATLVGSASPGAQVQVDLWVGQQDSLLYQVQVRGKVTASEKQGIVRVVKLSAFGQPVAITPPIQ